MVHPGSEASGASRRRPRSAFELTLTDRELAELDAAVAESGAWTRSLLVSEAIHAGLLSNDLELTRQRRLRRVPVRVASSMLVEIRQLASSHGLTQQAVLRHLLFRFIANAPWNLPDEGRSEKTRQTQEVQVQ